MFDFIPLEYYTPLYYYVMLLVLFTVFLRSLSQSITSIGTIKSSQSTAVFVLFFVIIYIGFRPISGSVFGDMATYASSFENYQNGEYNMFKDDLVFDLFIQVCAKLMTVNMFFLVCTLLYVLPLWFASKKWFKEYSFYSFFGLVISFSFFAYGTNGIRNGIATSFFVFALSRENLKYKFLWILLAVGVHKSMLIPTAGLGLTYFYKNAKYYFYGWLVAIPLSLMSGGFWEGLFSSVIADDRVTYLTDGNVNDDVFSSTGFRWDFLIYSGAAVFCAYYFIFKKNFNDKNYNRLVSIYLTSNAFWILVIRANFSNRFAYLSWFLMAVVIFYPFSTKIQFSNQHKILGLVLLAYFGFTFLMNVILS